MTANPLNYIGMFCGDKPASGLVPVYGTDMNHLTVDEQAAVVHAQRIDHIDYIFFRRFAEDDRSSQVAAYVIDNCDEHLSREALARLHAQVWVQGVAPLLYVAWQSRIDVLSCARGADFWEDDSTDYCYPAVPPISIQISTAGVINSELRKISAVRLADGTFWDDPDNSHLADHLKTAHRVLIEAVVEVDKKLKGEDNPTLRRLLLLMVLIKYLEDRGVFPENMFANYRAGATCFLDVLHGGNPQEVRHLLRALETKFDGDVFSLPDAQSLTTDALHRFAELVEGQTLKGQRSLWKLFSFEHLPVEIISHLYQRFVKKSQGTVYTPPFLAALLLDHAMPYAMLSGDVRVLDPACGSGVFLVGAFRRLVNRWRSDNGWRSPDVCTLKQILRKSIFGVELKEYAVDLTAFSLYLALCDALQPNVIWAELQFDRLRGTNLVESDFFKVLEDSRKGIETIISPGFDVVIGNPPFESELSEAAACIDGQDSTCNPDRVAVPDRQVAYLFLEQSLRLLRDNGRVCLIQPSSFLYNLNVGGFRRWICREYQLDAVLDFSSIRQLFDMADPKAIAISARRAKPSADHLIHHWTFRRTMSVKERLHFELDHYDRHQVSQESAETDHYTWRVNLLGGGRLGDISQRLRGMRTLSEYLVPLTKNHGWDYGEGFKPWNPKDPDSERSRKYTPVVADWLTDKRFIPPEALADDSIDTSKIGIVEHKEFKSGACSRNRYTPPLVLIRETDRLPVVYWNEDFIGYGAQIVGIHAPVSEADQLQRLCARFAHSRTIYRLHCALHSPRYLVGKATSILKSDIDRFPYPEDESQLALSFWESALCDDVLDYMVDYVRLGQNSDVLRKKAEPNDIRAYADMFVRMLGTVYDNLTASDPFYLNGLICVPFYFGEQPLSLLGDGDVEEALSGLIYGSEAQDCLRTVRVLSFYSENVMLLVKPDRLRYWIRSTAIRDADETLIDLRQQGY